MPIPTLQERARALRADTINLGKVDLDEETAYEPMKVGQQVQKCVSFDFDKSLVLV